MPLAGGAGGHSVSQGGGQGRGRGAGAGRIQTHVGPLVKREYI